MKKTLVLFLLISMICSVTGCSTAESSQNEEPTDKIEYPILLAQKVWEHPVISCEADEKCTELVYITTFGKCCYYEKCGKEVGNSFSYKNYVYDADTQTLALYDMDRSVEVGQMKVLRYDDHRLLIQTDMGIKEFYFDGACPNIAEDCRGYMSGYSSYCSIVELNENTVGIGSSHYKGNEELAEDKLASGVQFYMLDVQIEMKGTAETVFHTYEEITRDDMGQLLSEEPVVAFVWYNDNFEVEKVLCYSVTKTYV